MEMEMVITLEMETHQKYRNYQHKLLLPPLHQPHSLRIIQVTCNPAWMHFTLLMSHENLLLPFTLDSAFFLLTCPLFAFYINVAVLLSMTLFFSWYVKLFHIHLIFHLDLLKNPLTDALSLTPFTFSTLPLL